MKAAGTEIRQLDGAGQRWGFFVFGVARYVGTEQGCRDRFDVFITRWFETGSARRMARDRALVTAIERTG